MRRTPRPTITLDEQYQGVYRLTSGFPSGSDCGGPAGTRELQLRVDPLDDRRLCVRVAGELDLATAEELGAQLATLLTERRHVVLDLGEVSFMDSSGLAVIITALKRAQEVGAELEIARPLPAQPQRLLELTGVLERLSFTAAPSRPPA